MQRLKQIIIKRWIKILTVLLGIMGIAACASEELYGCPNADYKFNGNVKNQNGENLEKIKISVKDYYQSTQTDAEGNYNMEFNTILGSPITIYCTDPNEEYKPDSLVFDVKYTGSDGDWYMGKAEKTANFVLKKKE
ncbi:MAG: radical SAM-associated putative lipoprotein [Bacteroidales bacterium]|nr:radical SAM-associated putative lipoprotein [Bacteroidales bacterium]